jgi:nuclear pore complex protein Nup98-Nup96
VANFAVFRRGFGGIRWDEPVDVRGLQLDRVVRLSKGCIEVYLDDDEKPDVGEGLNKPATVRTMSSTDTSSAGQSSMAECVRQICCSHHS